MAGRRRVPRMLFSVRSFVLILTPNNESEFGGSRGSSEHKVQRDRAFLFFLVSVRLRDAHVLQCQFEPEPDQSVMRIQYVIGILILTAARASGHGHSIE